MANSRRNTTPSKKKGKKNKDHYIEKAREEIWLSVGRNELSVGRNELSVGRNELSVGRNELEKSLLTKITSILENLWQRASTN